MSSDIPFFITPTWPAPSSVKAYVSTRLGGKSRTPFDHLNLGLHVGDDAEVVVENRNLFASYIGMPDSAVWLNQVHGTDVVSLPCLSELKSADASVTDKINQVCAVLTADCLPVFFCNKSGTQVAVAHAGWRGLCSGVLEATVKQFEKKEEVMVWFGPAIGRTAFEVGSEVRSAFINVLPESKQGFLASKNEGKWFGDLYFLARQRLLSVGVQNIYGGDYCTFTEDAMFYSYRREKKTGRMASVIWLTE